MARRPTAHHTARIPMAVRLAGPIRRRILISRPGTAIRSTLGSSPGTEGSSLTDFPEVCLFIFLFLSFSFSFLSREGREGGGGEGEEGRGGREGGRRALIIGHCFVFLGTLSTLVCWDHRGIVGIAGLISDLS